MWDVAGVNWGDVPGWLGAASLVLAFVIFNRDRQNAARSQVDKIGIWATSADRAFYDERGHPKQRPTGAVTDRELFLVTVTLQLRNASDLPVRIEYVGYELHSEWMVWTLAENGSREGERVPGRPMKMDISRVAVPPEETRTFEGLADLVHSAPGDVWAVTHGPHVDLPTLDLYRTEVVVHDAVIVDNAGRRWFVQPGRALRAKRRPPRGWHNVPRPL